MQRVGIGASKTEIPDRVQAGSERVQRAQKVYQGMNGRNVLAEWLPEHISSRARRSPPVFGDVYGGPSGSLAEPHFLVVGDRQYRNQSL